MIFKGGGWLAPGDLDLRSLVAETAEHEASARSGRH